LNLELRRFFVKSLEAWIPLGAQNELLQFEEFNLRSRNIAVRILLKVKSLHYTFKLSASTSSLDNSFRSYTPNSMVMGLRNKGIPGIRK